MIHIIIVLSTVSLISGLIIILLSSHWIKVTEQTVNISKLPKEINGLKVLHITDWHNKSFDKAELNILRPLEGKDFDLVVLTGDIIDSNIKQFEPLKPQIKELLDTAPVFAVLGNHDWYNGGKSLIKELESLGVIVLENTSTIFEFNGFHFPIVGVSDYFTGKADIDKAFLNLNGEFSLVITHDPQIFPRIAQKGPSILFAGHTHGGQLRLPFIPTIYAPGQGFFPKYGKGLYLEGDSVLFVSTGLGSTGVLPIRFWNRPELAVITLTR